MVKALDSSVHPLCSDTVRSPRSVLSTFLFHKRNSLGDRTPCSDCLESDLAVGDPCLQASECSSPPRWAWVRFPLLTGLFFFSSLFITCNNFHMHPTVCTVFNLMSIFFSYPELAISVLTH